MSYLEEFFSGEALEKAKKRIDSGEPEAYVIGKAWFYREEYDIEKGVLIPRPDTERVVEELCALLPAGGVFADLCCGSGCVGISALCERKDATCRACDINEKAVALSESNAKKNGVAQRYSAKVCDLRDFEPDGFDIIVSNPPYIKSGEIDTLDDSVKLFEPLNALDGGDDGLDFYRMILDRFHPRTAFIFEIGYDQAEDIRTLARQRGMTCEIKKDYGGNDRVATIRRIHD